MTTTYATPRDVLRPNSTNSSTRRQNRLSINTTEASPPLSLFETPQSCGATPYSFSSRSAAAADQTPLMFDNGGVTSPSQSAAATTRPVTNTRRVPYSPVNANDSLGDVVYKLKGDLQLLKALSFANAPSSAATRSVQKDLYRQLEERIQVIEDAVVSPSYQYSYSKSTQQKQHQQKSTATPSRQRSVVQIQRQSSVNSEESETLRHRLADIVADIRNRPSYPPSPKSDGSSRHSILMDEEIESVMSSSSSSSSRNNIDNGSASGLPVVATRSPKSQQRLKKFTCSPGAKFVAELSSLIDLDAGHHAALADIMDRKMR